MTEKTREQIEKRISLLEDEILANEQENRMYEEEIEKLTKQLEETDEPDASLADYDNSDNRYDDMDAQFRVALAKKNS